MMLIYRSNQAYEGALKESYKVLAVKTEEDVSKKTPNDIEKYFEVNDIFRARVLQLFKNYRQEWRNESTHDFNLFFDESEAFIALTSVSSFVYLLLIQIQEEIARQTKKKKLAEAEEKENVEKIKAIATSISKNPMDKLVDIIIEFSRQNSQQIFNNTKDISEVEVMGLFHAHIESAGKSIITQREPREMRDMGIDFLIEIDNEKLILEFKKGSSKTLNVTQLFGSLSRTNIFQGIVYYANFNEPNPEPKIVKTETTLNGKKYEITTITT